MYAWTFFYWLMSLAKKNLRLAFIAAGACETMKMLFWDNTRLTIYRLLICEDQKWILVKFWCRYELLRVCYA